MSMLANDHKHRSQQLQLLKAIMPIDTPLYLKQQLEIVLHYELMRALIETAKPYCFTARKRLEFAYLNALVLKPDQIAYILDMAQLDQQGSNVSADEFLKKIMEG